MFKNQSTEKHHRLNDVEIFTPAARCIYHTYFPRNDRTGDTNALNNKQNIKTIFT